MLENNVVWKPFIAVWRLAKKVNPFLLVIGIYIVGWAIAMIITNL